MGGMEQLLKEIREYAAARNIRPATVLQSAVKASGTQWDRWVAGTQSPTISTVDAVRAYMAANPPKKTNGVAA